MATINPPLTHGNNSDDPFDSLLTLEDTLYTTAYTLGTNAGSLAGRIEGRIFGLENGFEKFATLGALHGRGVVWASRLPSLTSPPSTSSKTPTSTTSSSIIPPTKELPVTSTASTTPLSLPPLHETSRLTSNTTLLHSLTDPLTFSTSNTEEAVADFDDRCKRAGAKAKVIERIVGENTTSTPSAATPQPNEQDDDDNNNTINVNNTSQPKKPLRKPNVRIAATAQARKKGDDSMEDFVGSRLLR